MANDGGRRPHENSPDGQDFSPPSGDVAGLLRRLAQSEGKGAPPAASSEQARFDAAASEAAQFDPAAAPASTQDPSVNLADLEAAKKRPWLLIAVLICGAAGVLALASAAGWLQRPFPATPQSSTTPAGPAPSASPPVSPAAPETTELQRVRKAMADCDREAAQDPNALHLLVVPIRPNAEASTALPGERYDAFFLATTKAALDSLQNESHSLNLWPFGFAIIDPATNQRKTWNMVAGITKLKETAQGFASFRVGFDVAGRGNGFQWSNDYSRQSGTCYWINVQFRTRGVYR